MAVLVTGGAGFIGSHTAVCLLDRGEDIVVFDNFSNSKPEALENVGKITGKSFKFYEADMLCPDRLDRIFSENDIEAVIHFAGYKAVGESCAKPLMYYRNNIEGTLNILEKMQEYGCKKFIFSSSATVYGDKNPVPFSEEYPTGDATNPYGMTKLMIEKILMDVCRADKEFSAVLLRYFNPIGAHESALIGEEPEGIPNNIMPYITKVATGKLPILSVFGDDYPTRDGSGIRDYIHVCDLAEGHLAALDYARENVGAEAFNLGTGSGVSVFELIAAFERASGLKVPYKVTERRAGDIAECYANPEKANRVLGWKAVRDLDKMCEDSARWATKNI